MPHALVRRHVEVSRASRPPRGILDAQLSATRRYREWPRKGHAQTLPVTPIPESGATQPPQNHFQSPPSRNQPHFGLPEITATHPHPKVRGQPTPQKSLPVTPLPRPASLRAPKSHCQSPHPKIRAPKITATHPSRGQRLPKGHCQSPTSQRSLANQSLLKPHPGRPTAKSVAAPVPKITASHLSRGPGQSMHSGKQFTFLVAATAAFGRICFT